MNLRNCEIVTDLEHLKEEDLKKALENNAIKEYSYILHDKDTKDDGTLKYKHYHIILKFKYPQDTKNICKWFSVAENFISKINGKYEDALLYLIHANSENKYQYNIEEVKSNFNYKEEIEKIKLKKENKGNNINEKSEFQRRKEEIITMIDEGVIREFNYTKYISALENDLYSTNIQKAFKYRTDKKLMENYRNLRCVFITGESGAGKTTYAKSLAEKNGYSYYISSGSNDVLDDYKGQDCLILDDLRPSCLGLSDLLKLLDNNTQSSVKSRYKNKVLECKLIVITTTLTLENFFNNVFSEEKETIIQLQRRCSTKIVMTVNKMYVSYWKNESRKYSEPIVVDNPVKNLFTPLDIKKDEMLEDMKDFLGLEVQEEKVEENNSNEDIEKALMQVGGTYKKKEFYKLFEVMGFKIYGNEIMLNTNGLQIATFEMFGKEKTYVVSYIVEVQEEIYVKELKNIL